jgi:hypothetical protein
VTHLRHPFRTDEAACFYGLGTSPCKTVDEFDLDIDWNNAFLILKSISWADLHDLDEVVGMRHERPGRDPVLYLVDLP